MRIIFQNGESTVNMLSAADDRLSLSNRFRNGCCENYPKQVMVLSQIGAGKEKQEGEQQLEFELRRCIRIMSQ